MNETFTTYINSKNRISGTDSKFTYKIEFPPNVTYNRVCVNSIKIPKSYNLISEPDNYFILKEGEQEVKVYVNEGNCGRRDFVRLVERNLNLISPNKWNYIINYAGNGEIDDGKLTFRVTGNNSPPSLIMVNGLYEQLGFNRGSTNIFDVNKLRSTNQILFQAEDTLFLHSDMIKNSKRSILQHVFVSGNPTFGGVMWECQNTFLNCKPLDGLSELVSFTLTDEDDYPMNLNGQNMVIILTFFNVKSLNNFENLNVKNSN